MTHPPASLGIVVCVDGSAASKVAVDWAARNAARRRATVTLAHVLPSASEEAQSAGLLTEIM